MSIVKTLLTIVVVVVVFLLVVGLFLKKEYTVERDITINKPKQQVFEYLKLLRNQNNFSKWARMDPKMKQEFKGTDGTVGFISSWSSEVKNVGAGEQEISKITEGQRIDYHLRFIKPFKSNSEAYLETTALSPDHTRVKWAFTGVMNYPMNVMLLFMNMDKMLGPDLQTGLDNLKGILEKP